MKPKCPKFEEFLKDISMDREDIALCITEFMGYILSNDEYCRQNIQAV